MNDFPMRIFNYSACKNCNKDNSCYECEVPYKIVYEPSREVIPNFYVLRYP